MNTTKPCLCFPLPAISVGGEDGDCPSAAWLVCSPVSPGLGCENPPMQAVPSNYPSLPRSRVAVSCSAVACLSLWAQSALLCEPQSCSQLQRLSGGLESSGTVHKYLLEPWHHLSAVWGHEQSPGRTLPTTACLQLHSKLCREVWAGWALPWSTDLHRILPFCPWMQPRCCLHLYHSLLLVTCSVGVLKLHFLIRWGFWYFICMDALKKSLCGILLWAALARIIHLLLYAMT